MGNVCEAPSSYLSTDVLWGLSRFLAGPLKQQPETCVLKTLQSCLGCLLQDFVVLQTEPSPQADELWNRFSSSTSHYVGAFILLSILDNVPAAENVFSSVQRTSKALLPWQLGQPSAKSLLSGYSRKSPSGFKLLWYLLRVPWTPWLGFWSNMLCKLWDF